MKKRNVGYIPPYWRGWCLKFQGNPTFNFYISSRENKETERDTEGVGWDMSIPQKLFIDWLFNGSVSRNVRINTISLVFRSRFHRQNITPLGPPLQTIFWMELQTPDRGCLYADVRKTDFRSKWPSKNNFTELDKSQSLDWQCPSLPPYFLLISYFKLRHTDRTDRQQ